RLCHISTACSAQNERARDLLSPVLPEMEPFAPRLWIRTITIDALCAPQIAQPFLRGSAVGETMSSSVTRPLTPSPSRSPTPPGTTPPHTTTRPQRPPPLPTNPHTDPDGASPRPVQLVRASGRALALKRPGKLPLQPADLKPVP